MSQPAGHEKGLVRVMIWGTALAFGILAAAAASMKDFIGGDVTFDFSFLTILAFVIGFVGGWIFWKFVLKQARKATTNK
jgi:hypothetical protein